MNLNLRPCTGGLNSEISKLSDKLWRYIINNLYILVLFLLLRTTVIRKNEQKNCETISNKASETLCLCQSGDSKFEANFFSVTLNHMSTIIMLLLSESLDLCSSVSLISVTFTSLAVIWES